MIDIQILDNRDIEYIAKDVLLENGKLKLLHYSYYNKFPYDDFRIFCNRYARYGIPTIETVECIQKLIKGRSAIEIGAGHGDLGYHLGITMTDSKLQEEPSIRAWYTSMKQPVINYPDDVEKLEAIDAIKKYKPQVVVGSWITEWVDPNKPCLIPGSIFGVKEDELLKMVEAYIIVGNVDTHGQKTILKKHHPVVLSNKDAAFPYILSRAANPENNVIFYFHGEK